MSQVMQIPPANKSVMMNRHYNNIKKEEKMII